MTAASVGAGLGGAFGFTNAAGSAENFFRQGALQKK